MILSPSEFKELLENIEERHEFYEILKQYIKENVQKVDYSHYDYYDGYTTHIEIMFKNTNLHSIYDVR